MLASVRSRRSVSPSAKSTTLDSPSSATRWSWPASGPVVVTFDPHPFIKRVHKHALTLPVNERVFERFRDRILLFGEVSQTFSNRPFVEHTRETDCRTRRTEPAICSRHARMV